MGSWALRLLESEVISHARAQEDRKETALFVEMFNDVEVSGYQARCYPLLVVVNKMNMLGS